MKLLYCVIYLTFIGIISNFIGDTFKRDRFDPTSKLFVPRKFEKNGEFYDRLKIRWWKDILPDMSKIRPSMVKKKIKKYRSIEEITLLAQETCVAELIHALLIIFAIPVFFIGGVVIGSICFGVWFLGNIPFIMIQRYNRARFILFINRLKGRKIN